MRAREWFIAYRYSCPADYGIPLLPVWEQYRDDDGRLIISDDGGTESFVSAANPMPVRR